MSSLAANSREVNVLQVLQYENASRETGLHISIDRQLDSTFTDEGHFEIVFFLGGPQNPCKHPEPREPFKWLARAELDLCTFPAANRSVVNLATRLHVHQSGRIMTTAIPWMASTYTSKSLPRSSEWPVFYDRFLKISAAAWLKSTLFAKQRT